MLWYKLLIVEGISLSFIISYLIKSQQRVKSGHSFPPLRFSTCWYKQRKVNFVKLFFVFNQKTTYILHTYIVFWVNWREEHEHIQRCKASNTLPVRALELWIFIIVLVNYIFISQPVFELSQVSTSEVSGSPRISFCWDFNKTNCKFFTHTDYKLLIVQ